MSDPENESKPQRRGAKHIRLRYYTSYEEATIVKLWRDHFHEIPSYSENLPIFREISFGLQQHRIRLNKQEVRRRISSYRNKYLLERGRIDNDPQYKSDWRLFTLVDCLFQPATPVPSPIVQTERKLIDDITASVRNELPSLARFSRHDCKTLKFEQDPNGCPFYEGRQAAQVKMELPQLLPLAAHIKTEVKPEIELDQPMAVPVEKRLPLAPANRTLEPQPLSSQLPQLSSDFCGASQQTPPLGARRVRRRNIMPRTGQITFAQIEQLRKENELLAEQRDANLADLELKEREYQQLEQTFDFWLHQQETWMAYLDERGIK